MAFDVLRSFHCVPAKITPDGKVETRIRWKPCRVGAKPFPGWHAYGSAVWEPHPDDWKVGPGIERGPLVYTNKKGYVPPGQEFHGPGEWFETGIPTSEIANLNPDSPLGTCWPPPDAIETKGKPSEPTLCTWDFPSGSVIRVYFGGKTGRFSGLPDSVDITATDFVTCIREGVALIEFGSDYLQINANWYLGSVDPQTNMIFTSNILGSFYLTDPQTPWVVTGAGFETCTYQTLLNVYGC